MDVDDLTEDQREMKQEAERIFNTSPKKGLEYLIEKKLVKNVPDLVNFLFRNENLEKEKIGEFLGEK
jgi:Sec7-like guanine-nucleotide exchange factor